MHGGNIGSADRGSLPDSSFKYTPLQHVRVLFASFIQGLFHSTGTQTWRPQRL
jgi:hypothetical protein